MPTPICCPLDASSADQAGLGGKGDGLVWLESLGLSVPAGFVVVGATPEQLPPDLDQQLARLGSVPLAIRSSASDEDGAERSFAGQFESLLNVRGVDAARAAIIECLESADSERVAAYRANESESAPPAASGASTMSVVVQEMVEASTSGVIFTADVVSGRRDIAMVDAVAGLGEDLMAGTASPDQFRCQLDGTVIEAVPAGDTLVLTNDQVAAVVTTAVGAAATAGHPLDCEWAIDASGTLWWVQARPVTALPADPRYNDDPVPDDHVLTRANVGEMMPGPVCALTHDFVALGIELGTQDIHAEVGVVDGRNPNRHVIPIVFGHLFLDLTELGEMSSQSIGGDPAVMARAITGRVLPELTFADPPPWRTRLPRSARYVREIFSTRAHVRRITRVEDTLALEPGPDAASTWRVIDRHRPDVIAAYDHHLGASSAAGAMAPTMLEILAAGDEPTAAHHAVVSRLLSGADAESADVARSTDALGAQLRAHPEVERLAAMTPDQLLDWLRSPAAGPLGSLWNAFMDNHGHRSVRELDLRQPEWRHEPTPVLQSMLSAARTQPNDTAKASDELTDTETQLLASREGHIVSRLAAPARRAVRLREASKSRLVSFTVAHKVAYRALGDQLVAEGHLPDSDLLFFCTHAELGRLSVGEATDLAAEAARRREALVWQETLRFPDVCIGSPEPLPRPVPSEATTVVGVPANPGRISGPARIISRLDEADRLQPGDILIAPVTDVGWTPWFGVVAAVVTDVGSSVSHGAVVAREYGIPAVVNTGDATLRFSDGDIIEVDGAAGTVRLADS